MEHFNLGDKLGLTLDGYVKMGAEAALKRPCIICGGKSVIAGVACADGTRSARQAIQTPNETNPSNHRLIFYGICANCQHDPNLSMKILNLLKKLFQHLVAQRKQNVPNTVTDSTPLVDGQTFSL